MRKSLQFEGWLPSENLPQNWLYKIGKSSSHYFIDSRGNMFQSKDNAIEYLKEKNMDTELKILMKFSETKGVVDTQKLKDWIPLDWLEGWHYKEVALGGLGQSLGTGKSKSIKVFLSPEG